MRVKIALIGMPAIGKTTIGRKLARHYGLEFLDLDHAIEAELGCSIKEYFERMGEAAFRDAETRVLDACTARPQALILSTGGGVVLRERNRALLRQRCHVVYLCAQPQMLLRRVRNDQTRPLLQVADPLQKLQELYAQRHPLYSSTADVVVSAEGGMRSVLVAIQEHLQQHGLTAPDP